MRACVSAPREVCRLMSRCEAAANAAHAGSLASASRPSASSPSPTSYSHSHHSPTSCHAAPSTPEWWWGRSGLRGGRHRPTPSPSHSGACLRRPHAPQHRPWCLLRPPALVVRAECAPALRCQGAEEPQPPGRARWVSPLRGGAGQAACVRARARARARASVAPSACQETEGRGWCAGTARCLPSGRGIHGELFQGARGRSAPPLPRRASAPPRAPTGPNRVACACAARGVGELPQAGRGGRRPPACPPARLHSRAPATPPAQSHTLASRCPPAGARAPHALRGAGDHRRTFGALAWRSDVGSRARTRGLLSDARHGGKGRAHVRPWNLELLAGAWAGRARTHARTHARGGCCLSTYVPGHS